MIALLSLLIANGLYQYVDVGQWQRLFALNIGDQAAQTEESDRQAIIRQVAEANLLAGLASAASWFAAVFLGVLIKIAHPGEDAFTVFGTALGRLPPLDQPVIAFFLVVALLSIMFSTLDALCSAVAFTVHNDLFGLAGADKGPRPKHRLLFAR